MFSKLTLIFTVCIFALISCKQNSSNSEFKEILHNFSNEWAENKLPLRPEIGYGPNVAHAPNDEEVKVLIKYFKLVSSIEGGQEKLQAYIKQLHKELSITYMNRYEKGVYLYQLLYEYITHSIKEKHNN